MKESEVSQSCPTLCDHMDCSQAPPSMGFSREEYWNGLPFPSSGDLPNPGIEPGSPSLQADALLSEPTGKPSVNSNLQTSLRDFTYRDWPPGCRKERPVIGSLSPLVAQTVKRLPTVREIRVQSLGQEDLLEKAMAPHSSPLSWKIPWMEEPGRL